MTKKELIDLLADVPDDMPIYCYDMAYGCYAPLTENDIDILSDCVEIG